MAGYVPDVDAFSMLTGIGNTLQNNQDRKDAGPLSIDLARAAAGLPPVAQQPQQPGIFGQIVNGAKNIFSPQPQAQAPTPVVNQRPISTSTNIPSDYLQKTAQIESGGDPNATNPSGASGLFQFTPGTAKQYGLLNSDGSVNNDPQAQTVAATKLAQDNATSLSQTLGRAPTGAELYLAHQQGAGGASALLANPSQGAVDALTPVYGSAQKAAAAITQNGGDPNMTAGQFAALWTNKYNGAGGQSQQPAMAFAGGTPAPSANPNASQQPSASPALPTAPQGVPSVGSTQTPMGQQIPPLSTEALSRALTNPYTKDLAQGLLTKYAQPNTVQAFGDTVYSVNARTGALTPLMKVPKEPGVQELAVNGADGTMAGTQKFWVSPDKQPIPIGAIDTSKMKSQYTNITDPAERQAAGVPANYQGVVQKDENGKYSFPGQPANQINLNSGKKLDDSIIEDISKNVPTARAAVNVIRNTDAMLSNLDAGMYTGAGANWKSAGASVMQALFPGALGDKDLVNSESFGAAAAREVAALAKSTSAAGHTTNMMIDFAKKISGSDPRGQADAIRYAINLTRQSALDQINDHNANVQKYQTIAGKTSPDNATAAGYYNVDIPQSSYPMGQDQRSQPGRGGTQPAPAAAKPQEPSTPEPLNPAKAPKLGSVPIPMQAAQDLKANPQYRTDFDNTFGIGASDKVLGPAK